MPRHALIPIDKPPRTFELGAFDTETQGRRPEFVIGFAMNGEEGDWFNDPKSLLSYLQQSHLRGTRFYAHNLSYDLGALLRYLPDVRNIYLLDGSCHRAVLGDGKRHAVHLADSKLMWAGMSLFKVGRSVRLRKYPTPPDLAPDKENVKEWHCHEHHKAWCLECYVRRDTEIVARAMSLLQRTVNALGGELRNTLASTALDLFRRRFMEREYRVPYLWKNQLARAAYYGGRVEPFALGEWKDAYAYDFRAMYPSVMVAHPYPDPNYLWGPINNPTLRTVLEFEGCSEVTVYQPHTHFPVLPVRRNRKLYFPTGTFRGTWCHNELRYFLEQGGIIKDVHYSLYAKETCFPFDRYVAELWSLRCELEKHRDPAATVVKILMNALSGKFAQRDSGGLDRLVPGEKYRQNERHRGGLACSIYGEEWYAAPVRVPFQPDFLIVIWSAYITAYARIKLHKAIMESGAQVLAVDTDSLFTDRPLPEEDTLGGLVKKLGPVRLEIVAPKVWRAWTPGGKEISRVRGVPPPLQSQYLDLGVVRWERPVSFAESLQGKGEPSEWIEVARHQHALDPKRRYAEVPGSNGQQWVSRPLDASELPA